MAVCSVRLLLNVADVQEALRLVQPGGARDYLDVVPFAAPVVVRVDGWLFSRRQ